MKKEKIILSCILVIIFLILMVVGLSNGFIHELLGLIIMGIVVIHLLYNQEFIFNIKKDFKNKKFKYILDIVLFISICLTVILGIFISKYTLTIFNLNNNFLIDLHHLFSHISFVLISIHIGLQWQKILDVLEQKLNISKQDETKKLIYSILTVFIMVIGIICIFQENFYSNFTLSNDSTNITNYYIYDYYDYYNKEAKQITIFNYIFILNFIVMITYYIKKKIKKK